MGQWSIRKNEPKSFIETKFREIGIRKKLYEMLKTNLRLKLNVIIDNAISIIKDGFDVLNNKF